jgi:hypothetical protein
MKMYEVLEVLLHVFLTSTLYVDELSASQPGRFAPKTSTQHPLDRLLDSPQSRYGRFIPSRNRTQNSSAVQSVFRLCTDCVWC